MSARRRRPWLRGPLRKLGDQGPMVPLRRRRRCRRPGRPWWRGGSRQLAVAPARRGCRAAGGRRSARGPGTRRSRRSRLGARAHVRQGFLAVEAGAAETFGSMATAAPTSTERASGPTATTVPRLSSAQRRPDRAGSSRPAGGGQWRRCRRRRCGSALAAEGRTGGVRGPCRRRRATTQDISAGRLAAALPPGRGR